MGKVMDFDTMIRKINTQHSLKGIQSYPKRWYKCIEQHNEYFESN